MAYTAIYRKFRPKTFSEIVGQDHITKTLKNQINSNRVGHAYLFNGGRGTGKTSAAKILARAVNCLNPNNGEPCNKCEICKGILSGAITDVVEMDAASNNSVEDIRTIREEVNFLPTIAKYRVYIIDEVHMLSTGAFNALLKTLEEPPEHVKFILATTEPQKLPTTILSRCQRFDFKTISNENIIKRLNVVIKEIEIDITQQALNTIAILSEGAMRDALSILERCIQDGITSIDEDYIKELVGIPKLEYIKNIIDGILDYDVNKVLETLNKVSQEGKDVNNFIWELIKFTKDLLIYKITGNLEIYSEDEVKEIEIISNKTDKERLLKIIYDLSELSNNIKASSQKTIVFQAGLISLCNNQQGNTNKDLERRISQLEDKINAVNSKNTLTNNFTEINKEQNIQKDVKVDANKLIIEQNKDLKPNSQVDLSKGTTVISKQWSNVLNNLKNNGKVMLYTTLLNTNAIELNDMTIGIEFPNGFTPFSKKILESIDNKNDLIKEVSMASGKEMNVQYIDLKQKGGSQNKATNSIEGMINTLDIPFNIID